MSLSYPQSTLLVVDGIIGGMNFYDLPIVRVTPEGVYQPCTVIHRRLLTAM